MKLKRILAGVMAATVLIASGNFNFTETNEVEAAVTFYQEISSDELKEYAYTNSYAQSGNDLGAAEAFDRNFTTLWHQNYNDTGVGPQNEASVSNPIYIQAKFAQPRKIGKLVYRDRDNGNNIIGNYMISYANSTNVRPEESEWKTIVTGDFLEADRPLHTVVFEPVEATHIRLTALSKIGSGSHHVTASEIYVYEVDNRSYEEVVSAKAPNCQSGFGPEKAIDGDYIESKFHTEHNHNAFDNKENWIDFNLGEVKSINSLELYYDVCADPYNYNTGKGNGRITGYEVWVSKTGNDTCDTGNSDEWQKDYTKVCSGTVDAYGSGWKNIAFEMVQAQYIRLVATQTAGGGSNNNKYVAILEMRVPKATSSVEYAKFLGGSLRKRGYEDGTSTAMRLGYNIPDVDGLTVSTWKWDCGFATTDESGNITSYTFKETVVAPDGQSQPNWTDETEYGDRVSNVVIKGIPSASYNQAIYSQLIITYTNSANEELTVYTKMEARCVAQVVELILGSSSANPDYAYASTIKEVMQGQ